MQKIFTDGASRGNPGPGGWGAILKNGDTVRELGGGEKNTTNNRMELTAVIEALRVADNDSSIAVYTDSTYVAKGAQFWIYGWKKNNWMTKQKSEVLNKDLWEEMGQVLKGKKIEWNIVKGHRGIPGNVRCDQIATLFADGSDVSLFDGKIKDYKIDLDNISEDEGIVKDSSRKGAKPFSYLSLVDGVLRRHATWEECKKCVDGAKGAKFRKAVSKEDEDEIISGWGYKKPE